MIRIKIAEMLGKHKMTRKQLAELTDIRPNTIGLMYDETIKRLEVEWLDKLCKVFNCELTDIIEFVPDPDDKSKVNRGTMTTEELFRLLDNHSAKEST